MHGGKSILPGFDSGSCRAQGAMVGQVGGQMHCGCILEVTEENDRCSDDGPSTLSQQVGAVEPGGCGGAWLTLLSSVWYSESQCWFSGEMGSNDIPNSSALEGRLVTLFLPHSTCQRLLLLCCLGQVVGP